MCCDVVGELRPTLRVIENASLLWGRTAKAATASGPAADVLSFVTWSSVDLLFPATRGRADLLPSRVPDGKTSYNHSVASARLHSTTTFLHHLGTLQATAANFFSGNRLSHSSTRFHSINRFILRYHTPTNRLRHRTTLLRPRINLRHTTSSVSLNFVKSIKNLYIILNSYERMAPQGPPAMLCCRILVVQPLWNAPWSNLAPWPHTRLPHRRVAKKIPHCSSYDNNIIPFWLSFATLIIGLSNRRVSMWTPSQVGFCCRYRFITILARLICPCPTCRNFLSSQARGEEGNGEWERIWGPLSQKGW